jgi:3-oxoacyl-[acyl-carrier protein] reductase
MDLGLKDATTVIVGGGRGMGLAAAHCLADDGARVALVGRTADVLDKAATELSDRGSPDALGWVADTGDAAAVQRVFDEIGERWNGELNVLINAVGPGTRGTFDDLTDEQWREAFDDGVMGMVHCVRSALPLLRKAQWARIVNFSAHSTQRQTVILPAIDKHFGHPAHMPRAGLPDEIEPVVAFLASRRNSYMTGANINVDGGSDFT